MEIPFSQYRKIKRHQIINQSEIHIDLSLSRSAKFVKRVFLKCESYRNIHQKYHWSLVYTEMATFPDCLNK